jgi:predicted acylesterase/phospholipase RssA
MSSALNGGFRAHISYKTHPEWKVVEAVYASSCLPIFFSPLFKENKQYIDGGIFLNYPLEPCIELFDPSDSILGIRKKYKESNHDTINESSNLIDYIMVLMNKMFKLISRSKDDIEMHSKYGIEIEIESPVISAIDLFKMVSSKEFREEQILEGCKIAIEYIRDTNT